MAPGKVRTPLRRNGRLWLLPLLAITIAALAIASSAPAQEIMSPPRDAAPVNGPAPPVYVFLNSPTDLSVFWKSLTRPDFVILRGDEYAKLLAAPKPGPGAGKGPAAPWAFAVESIVVSGSVENDIAALKVAADVSLAADGPLWASLRLDGLTLSGATEAAAGRDLPLRVDPSGGGWQVELSGRGRHTLNVAVLVPVRLTPEGKRFDLLIPESATTRIDVEIPRQIAEASAGPGEPLVRQFDEAAKRSRIKAELPPRGRLSLSWKVIEELGSPLPPLLVARGEIAMEVDSGAIRTRSSWAIRSLRGSASRLEWQLDPDDEILELELDGQVATTVMEKTRPFTRVTIPLADPIGPNQERRLIMTTRRNLPAGTSNRFVFKGFTLANAREQSGAIGIATSGNLWVSGSPGRGVRRIDPRNELPADLRARPATALAYRFSEQPFELPIRIEPSPPLVLAEGRTTVVLGAKTATTETRLDFQTPRGRLFDLTIGLPPGLEVQSVGPEDVVSSWQLGQLPTAFVPGAFSPGLRLLTLRLGPKVQEGGRYAVRLVGKQAIDPGGEVVAIALFQPLGTSQGSGRIAVLADPSLTAALFEGSPAAAGFRAALLSPPADWPWPAGEAPTGPPLLWLRHDESTTLLPLRITSHTPELSATTKLHVHLDRIEADVRQETECVSQYGTTDHIDLIVPDAIEGRWEVEGPGVSQRIDLGKNTGGARTVRLKLSAVLSKALRLRFHYKLSLKSAGPTDLSIPWLRVDRTTPESSPVHATIVAADGVSVTQRGGDWEPIVGGPVEDDETDALRLASVAPRPHLLELRCSALDIAPLPELVASRLLLRTFLGVANDSRTSARYWVETHDGSMSVALPPGGKLLRARVGGETVRQVEELADGGGLRVPFPESVLETPALVEFDYSLPADRSGKAWLPPRLMEGGVVQQTYWEVNVPWSRAVVGVPHGWTDENEWYWAGYVWKRRPWANPAALASWASGPESGDIASATAADLESRGDSHAYLFGMPGDPAELELPVSSRASLVTICSGSVLAVGALLILVWSPPLRVLALVILTGVLVTSAFLHPSVTFLVLQSGMIGLLLTGLLAAMQRMVGRRRPVPAPTYAENGGRGSAPGAGSTLSHTTPGSDDSTAIRPRPAQTSTSHYSPVNAVSEPSDAITVRPSSRVAERLDFGDTEP